MNYARVSDRPFIAKGSVHMRRKQTSEAQGIRAFYETHNIEIRIDQNTKEPEIRLTRTDEEE